MTPEDFYIGVDTDGPILECPDDICLWAHPIDPGNDWLTLRWALDAARDHLDDKEARHG